MFGFSFLKLIVLAILVGAVWYGFRWLSQRDTIADKHDRKKARGASRAKIPEAEEMVKCAVCGVYVSAGTEASCGRKGCPYESEVAETASLDRIGGRG